MRFHKFIASAILVLLATTLLSAQGTQAPGTWNKMGKLVYAAQEAYTLNDGRVFVPPTAFATVAVGPQILDPNTGVWTATAPTIYGRLGAAATVLNDGRVLVTGGQASLNTAEIYNPVTDQWSLTTAPLLVGRYFHRATKLADGRVLLTGGCIQLACAAATAVAEIYDPTTDSFVAAGSGRAVRTFHGATLMNSGKILITGGYTNTGTGYAATAEIYDPATNTWTVAKRMLGSRAEHTSTLLMDGRVLVTGGSTNYGALSKSTELYDPAAGTWKSAGPLPAVMYQHSASLLSNGKVLIAGGTAVIKDTYVVLRGAILFDPATSRFTQTGSMRQPRTQFGLTTLLDGRALAVGGDFAVLGDGTVYPGDSEAYQP